MARTSYYVTPHKNGKWAVKKSRSGRASSTHRKKSAAKRNAKNLAKKRKPSEVVIQGRDGKIQTKRSYGSDPSRYRG